MSEYSGAAGLNFFEKDPLARRILETRLPAKSRRQTIDRLSAFGALCGGELGRLIEAAHQDGRYPQLRRYDRWGGRVDEIAYCSEQIAARRLALTSGILPPTPLLERMTMAYLLNQNGEGGITCPLAMTEGLIELLETHGTPQQKKRWLPLLGDPDTPTPLTAGQFVTEKQGGSNVSENETRADQASDGTWRLTGLKWFCSNPGELWVTTAKPEGSNAVGLFLMARRLPDGSLNECHIQRLKDLSGTRGKATAEVEYRGARAELIGRASQGIAILLRTVLRTSRIHVAAASLGMMRRARLEAELFANSRIVLGRPAAKLPSVARSLARIEAASLVSTLAFFEEIALLERGDAAADVLVPLLKIKVSETATEQVRQARLVLAGGGSLRDFSILPRLSEDAIIQEIWEGTHPVLAGHALKALRKPASAAAFFALLEAGAKAAKGRKGLSGPLGILAGLRRRLDERLAELRANPGEETDDALDICETAWRALTLALLLRESGGPFDIGMPFEKIAAGL